MDAILSAYIGALMNYISMEYDNLPTEVTDEMESYFVECFEQDPVVCFPNAAGEFYERFMKTPEVI